MGGLEYWEDRQADILTLQEARRGEGWDRRTFLLRADDMIEWRL
jgi:hypothetical protein